MACYHPLKGYRSKELNPSGKRSITFNHTQAYEGQNIDIPCGQCIGCRLERSRQWAMRLMHESKSHKETCFLTLTYNDENLPENRSLKKEHFQKFMKRLRKTYINKKIRFYHCGEYGENYGRPHYHAIIFGHDFSDKKAWKKERDNILYRSESLEKLWPFGHSSIGDVTFESAAYVARYVTKKITGEAALHHYNKIDYETGEVIEERIPEYQTMSRRPGIGRTFYENYKKDIFPHDFVFLRGKKLKPPKYYNGLYELEYPSDYEEIKNSRIKQAKLHAKNNTRDRLDVREEIQKQKAEQLKRTIK